MAGRPLKFKTNEELQGAINNYFEYCKQYKKPETIAGLAYHLDIDRRTVYHYEGRDEFCHTIKKARDRILAGLEESLFTEGKSGQIFLAKNYGYSDKLEHEHSGSVGINIVDDIPKGGK